MTYLSKNADFEIDADDPWQSDVMEREPFADFMTTVVAGINQPFVLSLHSPFGTGKTTFLKTWQHDLTNQGFRTAYFNAWETDFSQDALSAFLISLKEQLAGEEKSLAGPEKFITLAKKAGGFMRRRALPLIAEAGARKLLTPDGAKEGKDLILGFQSDSVASFVGELAGEAFVAQEQAQKSMAAFRDGLTEIVKTAAESKVAPNMSALEHKNQCPETTEEQREKIIIFVDELDRCRPTYAIEVLECIKHLFSVERLVFVLAVDDKQLKYAVESVYGSNKESEGYLRRFIDWQVSLPKPSYVQFAKYLGNAFEILSDDGSTRDGLRPLLIWRTFALFSSALGLTLRQQERQMTEISLIVRSLEGEDELFIEALIAISILRSDSSGRFENIPNSIGDWQQAVAEIFALVADQEFVGYQNADELHQQIGVWLINRKVEKDLGKRIEDLDRQYMELDSSRQSLSGAELTQLNSRKHQIATQRNQLAGPYDKHWDQKNQLNRLGKESVLEVILERLSYLVFYASDS